MDIPEIHHQHGRRAFTEDCTLCGRCAEYCPDDQIIRVRAGSLAAFSSSRDYYKRQVKRETPDGERKVIRIARAKPADSSHGQIALLFCAGGAMEKRTYERRADRSGRL